MLVSTSWYVALVVLAVVACLCALFLFFGPFACCLLSRKTTHQHEEDEKTKKCNNKKCAVIISLCVAGVCFVLLAMSLFVSSVVVGSLNKPTSQFVLSDPFSYSDPPSILTGSDQNSPMMVTFRAGIDSVPDGKSVDDFDFDWVFSDGETESGIGLVSVSREFDPEFFQRNPITATVYVTDITSSELVAEMQYQKSIIGPTESTRLVDVALVVSCEEDVLELLPNSDYVLEVGQIAVSPICISPMNITEILVADRFRFDNVSLFAAFSFVHARSRVALSGGEGDVVNGTDDGEDGGRRSWLDDLTTLTIDDQLKIEQVFESRETGPDDPKESFNGAIQYDAWASFTPAIIVDVSLHAELYYEDGFKIRGHASVNAELRGDLSVGFELTVQSPTKPFTKTYTIVPRKESSRPILFQLGPLPIPLTPYFQFDAVLGFSIEGDGTRPILKSLRELNARAWVGYGTSFSFDTGGNENGQYMWDPTFDPWFGYELDKIRKNEEKGQLPCKMSATVDLQPIFGVFLGISIPKKIKKYVDEFFGELQSDKMPFLEIIPYPHLELRAAEDKIHPKCRYVEGGSIVLDSDARIKVDAKAGFPYLETLVGKLFDAEFSGKFAVEKTVWESKPLELYKKCLSSFGWCPTEWPPAGTVLANGTMLNVDTPYIRNMLFPQYMFDPIES